MKCVHISMPRLEVDRERTLALAATLIDVTSRFVKHAKHGYETAGMAVGAADVRAGSPNLGNGETDTAGGAGDESALLERIVDADD